MNKAQLIAVIAAVAAVVSAIIAVVNFIVEHLVRKKKPKAAFEKPRIWIPILLTVCCGALSFWIGRKSYLPVDQSRYGFETGIMGWTNETYTDSQGIISIAQSSDRAKFGRHSLKLTVDLEGSHANRSQGEAYVEIAAQNLNNKPITAWVYVPQGFVGERQKPNGIQIFVKDTDKNWRAEYGTWWDITPARVDTWQQITLTPSTTLLPNGYMEPGFDPTQIRAVGVRVAIGQGSKATYRGPIYIDAVNWP